MLLINNRAEYKDFYYYKNSEITRYPKRFPCFVKQEYHDGGLMGDYTQHYVIYPPDVAGLTPVEIFQLGLEADWIPI